MHKLVLCNTFQTIIAHCTCISAVQSIGAQNCTYSWNTFACL